MCGVARVVFGTEYSGDLPQAIQEQVATSAMVLRVHQDKTYPGAMVASLSVPWAMHATTSAATT